MAELENQLGPKDVFLSPYQPKRNLAMPKHQRLQFSLIIASKWHGQAYQACTPDAQTFIEQAAPKTHRLQNFQRNPD